MSRAWMPIYWGDYLKDTRDLTTLQHGAYLLLIAHYWQHEKLPTEDVPLATIAGVSVAVWRKIKEPIAAKFKPDWTHTRVEDELAKADRKIMQRAIAGQKGGQKSAVSRAVAVGKGLAEGQATAQAIAAATAQASAQAIAQANGQAKTKQSDTNHQVSKITSSEYVAAREEPVRSGEENQDNSAGLLASALPTGALARPPDAEPSHKLKHVSELTREDLEAFYASKRQAAA